MAKERVFPDPATQWANTHDFGNAGHGRSERSSQPFQLRGGAFTLLVLRLNDPKDPPLFQALADKIAQAPNFFRHAPVVIDLQNLADAPPFNMAELGRRLRQHQLVPIGVQNGSDEQNSAAVNAGWSLFPEGRQAPLRENAAPRAPSNRRLPLPPARPRRSKPRMMRRRTPRKRASPRTAHRAADLPSRCDPASKSMPMAATWW